MNEILSVIQMKATKQYFPVVVLYKVVQTFQFVDEIPKCDHLKLLKAIELYLYLWCCL